MRRNRWFGPALAVVVLSGIPGLAQGRPSLKLDRSDLTVLGAGIGSNFQVVESQLGEMTTFYLGDGGNREQVACYRSASQGDDTVLAFYFGALGGWTDVTRISVSKSRALSWSGAKCKSSTLVSRNLEFLRGLKLAATPADVIRVLGSCLTSNQDEAVLLRLASVWPRSVTKKEAQLRLRSGGFG
jgi:hypothetical protein